MVGVLLKFIKSRFFCVVQFNQEFHVEVSRRIWRYYLFLDISCISKHCVCADIQAGYTPLHTACHFGQLNMIRFLLDHRASVHATTKVCATCLFLLVFPVLMLYSEAWEIQ